VSDAVHVTSGDSASDSAPGPLPARMLNEFAYCPRLTYLMWVQGEWAESSDTVDGKFRHRQVDQEPKRRKPEQDRKLDLSPFLDLIPFSGPSCIEGLARPWGST